MEDTRSPVGTQGVHPFSAIFAEDLTGKRMNSLSPYGASGIFHHDSLNKIKLSDAAVLRNPSRTRTLPSKEICVSKTIYNEYLAEFSGRSYLCGLVFFQEHA
jgi:hypothetical protein